VRIAAFGLVLIGAALIPAPVRARNTLDEAAAEPETSAPVEDQKRIATRPSLPLGATESPPCRRGGQPAPLRQAIRGPRRPFGVAPTVSRCSI